MIIAIEIEFFEILHHILMIMVMSFKAFWKSGDSIETALVVAKQTR